MSNIAEDYVSFETAKLLKEKGFPQEYDIYHSMVYNEEDYEHEYEVQRMVLNTEIIKAGTLSSYPIGVPEPKCYCPTLQMVMKWLREKHHLSIEPYYHFPIIWCVDIKYIDKKTDSSEFEDIREECYSTYEEACQIAIKYCLEHLI